MCSNIYGPFHVTGGSTYHNLLLNQAGNSYLVQLLRDHSARFIKHSLLETNANNPQLINQPLLNREGFFLQDYLSLVRDAVGEGPLFEGLQQRIVPFLRFREEWKLEAFYLYGSKRLGTMQLDSTLHAREFSISGFDSLGRFVVDSVLVDSTATDPAPQQYAAHRGRRRFELTDHLGNVQSVVSDAKIAVEDGAAPGTLAYYRAQVLQAGDYYPFGSLMPGRQYNSNSYRYGFIGAENDNEISGTGNSQDHTFRSYDPRLGRYKSLDPLARDYPWNSPFAYAENRVIDGLDLEGLEYISFHHYANGAVAKTEFYKMTDDDIERLGGTTAGIHNSVPYGPGGKGVVHYYYNDQGERAATIWEQRQTGGASDLEYHGLYSGPGSVTHDGLPGSENYNFNQQPIDWADVIAKRHDEDYAAVASENYAGYLEDVRTLQADKDMVARIDKLTAAFLNPFAANEVEGVETPVRTSYSTEMDFTLLGQRIMINALATYKQWKVDNDLGNDDLYEDNREAFAEAHPVTAKILDQTQE